jgi:hypothetical protein
MGVEWFIHNASFARWQNSIRVFGFAYRAVDGLDKGTGHHTELREAWRVDGRLMFQDKHGDTYTVISHTLSDFTDAPDAYQEVLAMAGGVDES